MKKKVGRPKLKAKELKKIVPMRLSEVEIKLLKVAAGGRPLTTWMRETLLHAAGVRELSTQGITYLIDQRPEAERKAKPRPLSTILLQSSPKLPPA